MRIIRRRRREIRIRVSKRIRFKINIRTSYKDQDQDQDLKSRTESGFRSGPQIRTIDQDQNHVLEKDED